ncbi:Hypothetical predicted protein [Pelobates cultripes]|uniref:Uncharacterized protein n=1 Tax=Pelobates cultripes TaxID=61616 RepID=A0AAD1WAG4_PELCU|nr:Hypothetical predicted protein [Pelobates cultripes]
MAAPAADLQRLLQAYLEAHGRGALDELMLGVRSVAQEEGVASGQPGASGERRARRSRPPSRLSPSPVSQRERRHSGSSAAHLERPSVPGRRWTQAAEGVRAEDAAAAMAEVRPENHAARALLFRPKRM